MDERRRRFERMVQALSGDLYRYAYVLCRHDETAKDLVQEALMRAWRFLETLRDSEKARSWLFTTVRRENARLHERRRLSILDDFPLEQIPEADGDTAQVLELREAMLRLPEVYRDVLVLQVLGGYSGKEIAAMMDIPLATVNTRLFRAREHLRRRLQGEQEGMLVEESV